MTTTFLESRPSPLPNQESTIADQASITLARHLRKGEDLKIRIADDQEEELIVLPFAIATMLLGMLRMKANGLGIAVTPLHSELTTSQAAELLNMSRPHLIKLLDAGDIPYHMVGKHRRIQRENAMAYKRNIRQGQEAFLDRLAAESQELGLYD